MSPELRQQLDELGQEWLDLEGQLKRYETLAGEALSPAVFSLRYAGRQMAICLRAAAADTPPPSLIEEISDAIKLTQHYLKMAKYDILDGVLIHVDRDVIRNMIPRYGHDVVASSVVNLPRLLRAIEDCRAKVIQSRSHPEQREALYDDMLANYLATLLDDYQEVLAKENESIMARKVDHELHLRSEKAAATFGIFIACYFGSIPLFLDVFKSAWHAVWPLLIPILFLGIYYCYIRIAWPNRAGVHVRRWGPVAAVISFLCVAKFGDAVYPEAFTSLRDLFARFFSRS
jgi:hypothetical protein